jgi:DHA1 family bicyclomycin/chloramphenicol resistance-like MFS transporter
MPIVGMAVDLIAPSLPAISKDLNVSNAIAKDVISLYLLGYALGNFFTGFLTDAWGRQKLIRLGLISFVAASLLPVIFKNIEVVLFARLAQGLTIGCVAVIIRAILSDILPSSELTRLGVLIGAMFGLGPVIGPVIGGYLQYYFGYQACFSFFALIALIGFIVVFAIVPETHFNRQSLKIKTIKHNLMEVLTHKHFMALVIIMGSVYSLIITFNTIGPFLIQTKLNYTPVFFGHIALCMGLLFLLATFICRYLLKKYAVEQLFLILINIVFSFTILAVILSFIFDNNIYLINIISGVMFFTCGFLFPMSMGKGLSLFRHIAGTATATMYLINIMMTSIIAFILSFIDVGNAIPMMLTYLLLISICMGVYWKIIHK